MFSKQIIDSDAFLDMPLSSQTLYFHLNMRADDDGFVNNPKKIQRMIGCSDDDLKLLLAKRFILAFESGVIVIKHWKIHNYIQKDRYKPTIYQEEYAQLFVKENKSYTDCIQNVSSLETQARLGKDRLELGKDRLGYVDDDTCAHAQALSKIIKHYENTLKSFPAPATIPIIEHYLDHMETDVVCEAITRAAENGKATWQYTKGILNNWKQKGVKTIENVKQEDANFKQKKDQDKPRETVLQRRKRILEEQIREAEHGDDGGSEETSESDYKLLPGG